MKRVALISLILVLGLGGCASYGVGGVMYDDSMRYWKSPEGNYFNSQTLKEEFADYGKNPGGYWDWEMLKHEFADYWKNPGGYWDQEMLKKDWADFWNFSTDGAGGKVPEEGK